MNAAEQTARSHALLFEAYRRSPVVYARQILGVHWWAKQAQVARALVEYKKVLVRSANNVGKSHLAAGLVNWFFDTHNPSTTITTAPTQAQVEDILWREIRAQRKDRSPLSPKAARMEDGEFHFAVGFTARDENAFQGKHNKNMLGVLEEATGIEPEFWEAMQTMISGGDNAYELGIFNPTDKSARVYDEERSGKFHVITISALDHPNIAAELAGNRAPIPSAIRLSQINQTFSDPEYFEYTSSATADSIEWPPASGVHFIPTPIGESRILGRWPSQGATSVWRETLLDAIEIEKPVPNEEMQIGCDVAREGDDSTVIFMRRGSACLWAESHNGWLTTATANRLMALATEYGAKFSADPKSIVIAVDDTGVGGGVTDQIRQAGYAGRAVNFGSTAQRKEKYPNKRSELWFVTVARAEEGMIDISRLPAQIKMSLRRELQAPQYSTNNPMQRREVESKKKTKERIGKSPDFADAFNLCFYPIPTFQFYAI